MNREDRTKLERQNSGIRRSIQSHNYFQLLQASWKEITFTMSWLSADGTFISASTVPHRGETVAVVMVRVFFATNCNCWPATTEIIAWRRKTNKQTKNPGQRQKNEVTEMYTRRVRWEEWFIVVNQLSPLAFNDELSHSWSTNVLREPKFHRNIETYATRPAELYIWSWDLHNPNARGRRVWWFTVDAAIDLWLSDSSEVAACRASVEIPRGWI